MNQELQETINYIREKAGEDYHQLNKFLESNRLFIFLVTKKQVGKSIYSQYLREVFPEKFFSISFGQKIRDLRDKEFPQKEDIYIKKWGKEIVLDIKTCSVERLASLKTTSTVFDELLSELPPSKSILFDGLPREFDQITLVTTKSDTPNTGGHRVIFLLFDLADEILNARISSRHVCPKCNFVDSSLTPIINTVEYDKKDKSFHLICPKCNCRLVQKKGDFVTPAVLERRKKTEKIMSLLQKQLPKEQLICMRTDVPVAKFTSTNEDLNLTANYSIDAKGNITCERKPLTANWQGKKVYSLSPKGAVVKIIKALAEKVCT